MPTPLDRHTLESMKRADLQRLCKDQGIKANLKSEALVDLLLDTMQPRTRTNTYVERKRSSSLRVASRSTTESRHRGLSGGSMIIHDTDDEEEPVAAEEQQVNLTSREADPPETVPPAPRTRKARQTQYRLGVGRPTLAGGSGPRAITRSTSISKTTRGKGSRSLKPTEDAIQEVDEDAPEEPGPVAGPSGTSHDPVPPANELIGQDPSLPSHSQSIDELKIQIERIIQPFKDQIQSLQADVQSLTARLADVDALKTQLAELTLEVGRLQTEASRIDTIESEVRKMADSLSDSTSALQSGPSAKSLGKARAMDNEPVSAAGIVSDNVKTLDSALQKATLSHQAVGHPVVAQSLLGKRHRDTDDSDVIGVLDAEKQGEYDEKELTQGVLRPTKKRPKLSPNQAGGSRSPVQQTAQSPGQRPKNEEDLAHVTTPPAPAFTVFSGPEEPPEPFIDPPPPTTHLSDLLELPPAGLAPPNNNGSGPMTSTANANENAQQNLGFNFSFATPAFQPITSTPAGPYGAGMPTFSYPEPPTSPTPGANPSGGFIERAGGRLERNDLFHPLGPPPRPRSSAASRPPSRASRPPVSGGTINPATLLRTPPLAVVAELDPEPFQDIMVSSTQVGQGLGMAVMPPDTPVVPMKRTMYGTELEGDTRFGDFGVEGVANGFWTGRAPRF